MPISFTIKNVPDDVADRLRRRAARNRRSLQGELLSILEAASREGDRLTGLQLLDRVRHLELHTPDEARDLVREDRRR